MGWITSTLRPQFSSYARLSIERPITSRMFDPRPGLVEGFSEEGRLVLFVVLVGDDRSDAARPGGGPVRLAGIALVGDDRAGFDVRADIEQDIEVAAVRGFAAGQVEGGQVSAMVGFGVDFRREPAARAAERLAFLPPFAPAAETCARTMVESNIWVRCAEELIDARASKKASNTPGLAQAVEPLPDAVPGAEFLRQGAPAHVLDREEMQRLQKPSIILGLAAPSGQAGAKHRQRVRPVLFAHLRR